MDKNKFYKNFWRLVKLRMEAFGYNATDLGRLTGTSRTTWVMRFKNSGSIELHAFLKICEVLEIPPYKVTVSIYKHCKEIENEF